MNLYDASLFGFQEVESTMAGFQLAFTAASSVSMVRLGDAQLTGIVHFKLFIAVQGSGETIENGIDSVSSFTPFSGTYTPSIETTLREPIGTDVEVETVIIVQVTDIVQHSSHGAL